jgi:hydrogenase maturation protease
MSGTLIVGVGSPAGDDQAGWKAVELLGPRLPAGARACALREPTHLLDVLEGCERLILIDAVLSGRAPGAVCRLVWPCPEVEALFGASSHGLGLGAVLALADRLGRLPARVVLFGVEGQVWGPDEGVSPAVTAALPGLCEQLERELGAGP